MLAFVVVPMIILASQMFDLQDIVGGWLDPLMRGAEMMRECAIASI